MCGRFLLDIDFEELYRLFGLYGSSGVLKIKRGDLAPTDLAPVFLAPQGVGELRLMRWGLPGYEKHQLLINARSETVLTKQRFSRLMVGQRCVIPATAFYEWGREGGHKQRFTFESENLIFFAGLYEQVGDSEAFTLLTLPSQGDVARVHGRMPAALEGREAIRGWTQPTIGATEAYGLLVQQTPKYRMRDEGGQLSFI